MRNVRRLMSAVLAVAVVVAGAGPGAGAAQASALQAPVMTAAAGPERRGF